MDTQQPARRQHYLFVHNYLRDKCLDAPFPAIKEFFHENATDHLKIAWVSLGMGYKDPEEDFIPADEVQVVPFLVGENYRCAVLVFPKPERLNEAFMSAIVVPSDKNSEERAGSRYFTLEYNPDRPLPRTYIGQWTSDIHFNLESGPVPTVDNFIQAISDIVRAADERPKSDFFADLFKAGKTEREASVSDHEAALAAEIRLAERLGTVARAKTERQWILESDFTVDRRTKLLLAGNVESVLIVENVIKDIPPNGNRSFTGFYLNPVQTESFRKRFEVAFNNALSRRDDEIAGFLEDIIANVDAATHPELRDLGFAIDLPELPVISQQAFEEIVVFCYQNRRSNIDS